MRLLLRTLPRHLSGLSGGYDTSYDTKGRHRTRTAGFSLIELMIVLIISGLIIGAALQAYTVYVANQKQEELDRGMDTVRAALSAYVRDDKCVIPDNPATGADEYNPDPTRAECIAAGLEHLANEDGARDAQFDAVRFPCPADPALPPNDPDFGREECDHTTSGVVLDNGVLIGSVPLRTLGISAGDTLDPHGNRLTYAVTGALTMPDALNGPPVAGAVQVVDGAGNALNTQARFTVVAHGENGTGAYTYQGNRINCGGADAGELENCDDDNVFRSQEGYTLGTGETYDDRAAYTLVDDDDDMWWFSDDGGVSITNRNPGDIVMSTNGGSNTGIGTNAPAEKLDVDGNARVRGDVMGERDVTAGRDVTSARDVTAARNVLADQDINAARHMRAAGNVAADQNVTAGQDMQATRDVTSGRDMSADRTITARKNVEADEDMKARRHVFGKSFFYSDKPSGLNGGDGGEKEANLPECNQGETLMVNAQGKWICAQGSGAGNSLYPGWPDIIMCKSANQSEPLYHMGESHRYPGSGNMWYGAAGHDDDTWIRFSPDGSMDGTGNAKNIAGFSDCSGDSIGDFIAKGNAFNYGAGGGNSSLECRVEYTGSGAGVPVKNNEFCLGARRNSGAPWCGVNRNANPPQARCKRDGGDPQKHCYLLICEVNASQWGVTSTGWGNQ